MYLKLFWTQLENVHLQGPCRLRPCGSRPSCTNLNNFTQVLVMFNIPFCSFDAGLILLTIKLILSQTLVPWTLTFIVPIQTIQESITDFPVWNTMSRASGTFQWSLRTSTAQAVTLILIRTVHAVNDAITSVDHVDAHKDLKLKNFIYQALHELKIG